MPGALAYGATIDDAVRSVMVIAIETLSNTQPPAGAGREQG